MFFSTLLSSAALIHFSTAGYVLKDDYMKDFFGAFDFFEGADPTNGFVKFVDEATARSSGLINASTAAPVQWGVEHVNKAPQGRQSLRIESKKSYETGLVVLDVEHMPQGCGTWPAFWMVGDNWPNNGEIDIIEGVNEQETNSVTLHTGSGCSIDKHLGGGVAMEGLINTANCDVNAQDQAKNAGCGIKQVEKNSYGTGLNANKGGVYATEWANDAISVWFFPRGSVPTDVLGEAPDPTGWGIPSAKFSSTSCNIQKMFNNQKIIFDTTFCGDWAGELWSTSTCASKAATCNDYVQNNPKAFADAYWTINALKVYQSGNNSTPVASSSAATIRPTSTRSASIIPSGTSVPSGSNHTSTANGTLSTRASLAPTLAPPVITPTTLAISTPPSSSPTASSLGSIVPSGRVSSISSIRTPRPSRAIPSRSTSLDTVAPIATGGFVWPKGHVQPEESATGTASATQAASARRAMHIRQHRRRMTHHNARH